MNDPEKTATASITSASDDAASSFLKDLQGDYAGRGTATIFGSTIEKIACRVSNSFDEKSFELSLKGECASTKGKSKIDGQVVANGNNLVGTFVSMKKGVKITQSGGQVMEGKMMLFASLFDEQAGKLTKIQQLVEKTDVGINAKFFQYDNFTKTYKQTGSLELVRR